MSALDAFSQLFAAFTGEQLKALLESKHLYQKVSVLPTDVIAQVMSEVSPDRKRYYLGEIQKALFDQITLTEKPTFSNMDRIQLWLPVKNVKLFCVKCDGREAFRPSWFSDITKELLAKSKTEQILHSETFKINFPADFQLLSLVYQCQRCESLPNAFIVKRSGTDLYLEGRSPIEHVELPTFIPKQEQKWFRDAVIAYQTGKTLAALFYLRTFIEQFARRLTKTPGDKKTGDEILTAYAETLSSSLRDTMPSLREWYGKLSAALHTATEDAELFESAREKVEEHFDIRRVHKLDLKVENATNKNPQATAKS